jgi:probable rRNA maturation factor
VTISFHASVKVKIPSKKKLRIWLSSIASSEKRKIKNLAYNFCSDEELLHINLQFLKHNTYTDIITFDYSEKDFISGEIFISIERVKENAAKEKTLFEEELIRVIAHGLLHLSGYKDKSTAHKKTMRIAENKAIKAFKAIKN